MASTAVAVGGQLPLSLILPRKGAKSVAGRSRMATTPRVVSASACIGGRPQQFSSSIAAAQVTGFSDSKTRFSSIIAKASEQADPSEQASEILKSLQESWNKVDDKLAIGGLGFAGLIILWASTGLIGALDKLPLIPDFFEFIGILFSGWFTYRYLLFKPDREELLKIIDEAKAKITGNGSYDPSTNDATTPGRNRSPEQARSKKTFDVDPFPEGGQKRRANGTGLDQLSAEEDSRTGENGRSEASSYERRLGRDEDRESTKWEVEGTVVGEWEGFRPDTNDTSKFNGTARADVSV